MSDRPTAMADKRNSKYLTAGILAVIAICLFVVTLYNGLR